MGDHSVTVIEGLSVSSVVNLNTGDPSTQPYGIAVDDLRNLVYVATVNSHRVAVIGTSTGGVPDQLLGWAEFHRGGDPTRPVPMRVIAVNPDIGPYGDGGHVWTTTSTADGSEANQALLIPKGWSSYFSYPVPRDVGANPSEGIAVHRPSDTVYVTSGTSPGSVTVLGDNTNLCVIGFGVGDGIDFDLFLVE
jgi:DNA-binding beta-propeller fold protein YncE